MGVGRNALIREFGLVPSMKARAPGAEAVIHGNVYLDWKTGFAFSKPTGWDFETPEDPCRTFGGVLINSGQEDESMPVGDWFDPEQDQPLLIAFKSSVAREIVGAHGPDDDTLGPTLSVTRQEDCPEALSLLDFVESILPFYQQFYRAFEIVSAPRVGALSRCESVDYTTTFLYGHQNLPEWIPIRERVVFVAQDTAIYSLHMYDYPAVSPELIQDFDSILTRFRFA